MRAFNEAWAKAMEPDDPTIFRAWDLAHEITGAESPPAAVQHDAFEAAEAIGGRFDFRRVLDEHGRMVYEAGLITARGEAWVRVTTWGEAIRELGLED